LVDLKSFNVSDCLVIGQFLPLLFGDNRSVSNSCSISLQFTISVF